MRSIYFVLPHVLPHVRYESEKIFACGICNPAQDIRNPANDWNPESKFHWQRDLESITRNPESTEWIPLHRAICRQDRAVKKPTVTLMINFPSFTANT